MTSYSKIFNTYKHIELANRERLQGALVEMGCWRGGLGAFMAWASKVQGWNRLVWLFDSFVGVPEASPEDAEWARRSCIPLKSDTSIRPAGYYVASEDSVKEVANILGVVKEVQIVKGWFQNTVPRSKKTVGNIAILRLDGDLYESTKYCLEELYDNVVRGGIVVVDDYNLEGCRTALYEFFAKRRISPFLQMNLYGGDVYFRKP